MQCYPASPTGKEITDGKQCEKELARLEEAYAYMNLYIVGKEQMKIKDDTNYARRLLLWACLWIRDNTRDNIANLRLPTEKVIEVGFLKEI